jgi:formate--tetrahydrofolate ligase
MPKAVQSDIAIAQKARMRHIRDIAAKLGLGDDQLEPYGKHKAKLPLILAEKDQCKYGKLILVSAITPTPAGEGKTTVSIGLNDGLNRIGKKSMVVLREPSLGPVFGIKGGATGGGWSQVCPWRTSTSTSPGISRPSRRPTTSWPPSSTTTCRARIGRSISTAAPWPGSGSWT